MVSKEEFIQETIENIKLEEVLGSSMCQYTVIENKLATLYKNQEQILKAIKLLNNQNKEISKEELTPEQAIIKWCEETSKLQQEQDKNMYNEEDFNHLEWIYNRLISVHNESPNYDYMLKFKSLIKEFKNK
jgi:hypothetical protein